MCVCPRQRAHRPDLHRWDDPYVLTAFGFIVGLHGRLPSRLRSESVWPSDVRPPRAGRTKWLPALQPGAARRVSRRPSFPSVATPPGSYFERDSIVCDMATYRMYVCVYNGIFLAPTRCRYTDTQIHMHVFTWRRAIHF